MTGDRSAPGAAAMADAKRQMTQSAAADTGDLRPGKSEMAKAGATLARDRVAAAADRRKVAAFLTKPRSFKFTGRLQTRRSITKPPAGTPPDETSSATADLPATEVAEAV
jgi:hypothetical protein